MNSDGKMGPPTSPQILQRVMERDADREAAD
jgi:hypothetical protein